MQRREFIQSAAVAATAMPVLAAARLPQRTYKDEVKLSIIGFGGIVVCGQEQKAGDRMVSESVDRGVNYFDVAPSYFDGEAEIKLGIALKPYRKRVFLACKTNKRDAAGARAELQQSQERLHTDRFDLYQFHAVASMKDVEQILAPGGAAEVFSEAKKQGKVRYLGMSAHNAEAAIALMDRFPLDSILFPVNYVLYSQGHFGPQILAHAKEKGLARLALKALAKTSWEKGEKREYAKCWYRPIDDRDLAAKALRFTLSEDITAAIPPGDERIYTMALELARSFKPLAQGEREELLAGAKGLAPIFKA